MRVDRKEIDTLAERTADAYSWDRYRNWRAVGAMLLRRGYTPDQAEEILRSKLTRWAGDASGKRYGTNTSKDLARYIDKWPGEVARLFAEV